MVSPLHHLLVLLFISTTPTFPASTPSVSPASPASEHQLQSLRRRTPSATRRATFPQHRPTVCVAVLSWNRLDLLRQTLSSAIDLLEASGLRYNIAWVDNGSDNQTAIAGILRDYQVRGGAAAGRRCCRKERKCPVYWK